MSSDDEYDSEDEFNQDCETIYFLIDYMFENEIFNTIVTTFEDDKEFSIILKTKNPKLSEILGHLETYRKIKNDDTLIGDDCIICLEEFKENQYKRTLGKCSHHFHKKCIDKWFMKNRGNMNCPICRTNYNKKITL